MRLWPSGFARQWSSWRDGWLAAGEWPKWHWNALGFPADVGWAMFLRLWARYNVSLPIEEGGRELLRIEVLEARANGEAKFACGTTSGKRQGPTSHT